MAKGAEAKQAVIEKILKEFEGSFLYNGGKEIRIPYEENGNEIQIKVSLTCAKDNVCPGEDKILPGETVAPKEEKKDMDSINGAGEGETTKVAPTEKEKEEVAKLMAALNF